MTRVTLINMPFADWNRPSFALSYLSALARRELGPQIEIEIRYLNLDFAQYLGPHMYDAIAGNLEHLLTGAGEWFFRQVAFPVPADNTYEYFRRYYKGESWRDFRADLVRMRSGLRDMCEKLIDTYRLDSADIVGFTSMFAQTVPSLAMSRLIKERSPGVITIMGGANCEAPMGAVLASRADAIDAIFSGPASHTFPEFLRHVHEGNRDAVHSIPGIITRKNLSERRFAQAIGRDRDIDDYVEPDYSAFVSAFSAYRGRLRSDARPVLLFETSRGCWWGEHSHCTFCGLNGLSMNYRAMSPEVALRQFRWLFSFAPWCQEFACTDNILPKSYPREVFSKLEPPPGVSVFYEVKLPVSERDMRLMSQAGVTRIQPGIEALSTETLRLMGKGTTAFLNLQFLKNCLAYGITPEWNLLIGFPGEKEEIYEKYAENLPSFWHLPPPSGAFMVRFDRFSPYFTDAARYGLDLRPLDFYRLVYPFDIGELAQLAYFFADQRLGSYLASAAKWAGTIGELVAQWRRVWEGAGAGHRPGLSLRRRDVGGWWIADSRQGTDRLLPAADRVVRILTRLASPVPATVLPQEVGMPAAKVHSALAWLRGERLLFEEDGRVMSLVTGESQARVPSLCRVGRPLSDGALK
ncbi:MAG TPA: RiPP maturation radical SAM C-methyltransferase [Streptosporangiaceae bacterium]